MSIVERDSSSGTPQCDRRFQKGMIIQLPQLMDASQSNLDQRTRIRHDINNGPRLTANTCLGVLEQSIIV